MRDKIPVFLTALISIIFFRCSNPVDEEPLRWKTVTEVPLSSKAFVIADEFDNLFDADSMDLLRASKKYNSQDLAKLEPDTTRGDTLEFSIYKTDSYEFEIKEEKLNDKTYTVSIGAVAISNAPELVQNINVTPQNGNFALSLPVTFQQVYQITFYDTVTNIMQVGIANMSDASINNFSLEIQDIGTQTVEYIAARQTAILQFPVSRKTINNQVLLSVTGKSEAVQPVQMQITTSVNGLYASKVKVDDHLVSLRREYVNPYELTDTLDIDYVDIKDGFFIYEVSNHTGIELRVRGIHEHLWKSSYAEINSYTRYDQLTNISHQDSIENHFGFITNGEVIAPPQHEQAFSQENISQSRLFAVWDDAIQKSVTRVRYLVSTGNPTGDTITISSSDNLIFTIRSDFKYNKLSGTVVKPYSTTSDTEKVAIEMPWGETSSDSLRGRFILQNVYSDVGFRTIASKNSYIDSVNFLLDIFIPDSPSCKSSASNQFTNVQNDSKHRCLVDITDIINQYPDTICMVSTMYVPRGSRIISVNDLQVSDPDYSDYIGKMIIGIAADYRLNARLDWEVVKTVNMDLEGETFPVYEAFRYIRKLDQKNVDLELKIKNSSSLDMSLYALIAPQHLMDSLDSMAANQAFHLMINEGEAEKYGFVNFLGTEGLAIPSKSKDSMYIDTIHWDQQQLETILSSDTCSWRWFLQIKEQDRNALHDTDYIHIDSWLHIEGINNTDSLIIW